MDLRENDHFQLLLELFKKHTHGGDSVQLFSDFLKAFEPADWSYVLITERDISFVPIQPQGDFARLKPPTSFGMATPEGARAVGAQLKRWFVIRGMNVRVDPIDDAPVDN